jgi:hypothetical protein
MAYRSRHEALHAGFVEPDPEFSPAPIWWWSGAPVTLPRLCEQLDALVEQGVYNAVILNLAPTGPTYGALADEPALFSEAWWELWAGLCAHARTRGARLWFYDQVGFSGANLQGDLVAANPEFAGCELATVESEVDGEVTLSCPGEPVAAFAVVAGADPVPVPVLDGRATWRGTGRLVLVHTRRRGFDYTSPAACAALRDVVHGAFERRLGDYLGDVIVGSFTDELPSMPTWSPAFADEFATRCGYRIEPVISALWHDGGVEFARVRVDYQRVRAALAEEAFFAPMHAWHERHGLTVGVDQQSPSRAGEPLGCVRQYADYARTHRWYSAPGSDHWGDAKLHSSLAHHYGRPRTWIEAFHSTGWGGTLEETFDWLVPWLLAGATLYNPHAVYYSTAGGWWEWAPPSTCWRQPYWPHYRVLADTVARLCWLLTRGEHVCDVGVLFPSTTAAAATLLTGPLPYGENAQKSYLDTVGRMLWFDAQPGALQADGRDFDVLDDDTIAAATVVDGALCTRGERYRAVVLPGCRVLETATARKLVELAEAGGLVLAAGARPEFADTAEGDEYVVRLWDLLVTDLSTVERPLSVTGPALLRRVADRTVLVVGAAEDGGATARPILSGIRWSEEVEDVDMGLYNRLLREHGYDFDPARNRSATTVWLPGTVVDAEQWDPVTGAVAPAPARAVDGGTEVTVSFADAPLAVLVWSAGAGVPVEPPEPAEVRVTEVPLDGSWRSTVDDVVRQWRPEHRVGGAWRPVLVGHGPFAEVRVAGGEWRPVEYSLSRGIEKDPHHMAALGPKGRVPDEFWHVEDVVAGRMVRLRTTLPVPTAGERTLAVGVEGEVEVWWNGVPVPMSGGYTRLAPVDCVAGHNRLELAVRAERAGTLRGYWALTEDPAAFVRPEWTMPADGSRAGTTVRASATIGAVPVVQLGTEGAAQLFVNVTEVAVQGAFDPYDTRPNPRILPHDISAHLVDGTNRIEVVFRDTGNPVSVVLDGAGPVDWTWERDGEPVRTAWRRRQSHDARWVSLTARPHPLPRANWLTGDDPGGVLDLVPDLDPDTPRTDELFRLDVPPGAVRARLPVAGDATVHLDGIPVSVVDGEVELQPGRTLTVRIRPCDGRRGGALWEGPAEFECAEGELAPGPWDSAGLASYSGAVTYHRDVDRPGDGSVVLDLGAVRGTAEVTVNGAPAGVRIWSPYRFDLTGLLRNGGNRIGVTVRNTLAPEIDDTSPTLGVYAGQRRSGLLGPVRLLVRHVQGVVDTRVMGTVEEA